MRNLLQVVLNVKRWSWIAVCLLGMLVAGFWCFYARYCTDQSMANVQNAVAEIKSLPVSNSISDRKDSSVPAVGLTTVRSSDVTTHLAVPTAVVQTSVAGVKMMMRSKYRDAFFDPEVLVVSPDDNAPIPSAEQQVRENRIQARVVFAANDLHIRKQDDFDYVELNGGFMGRNEPGEPLLPVKTVNLLIPPGMTVANVRFQVTEKPGAKGLKIYPAQPPVPTSATNAVEFVGPNARVYSSDEVYPAVLAEVCSLEKSRGNRFVSVRLNPVRVKPASGELLVMTSVKIQFDVVPAKDAKEDLPRHPDFDQLTRETVINANIMKAADAVLPQPLSTLGGTVSDGVSSGTGGGGSAMLVVGGCKYLIITDDILKDSFQAMDNAIP